MWNTQSQVEDKEVVTALTKGCPLNPSFANLFNKTSAKYQELAAFP